jgi:hypothetical protein
MKKFSVLKERIRLFAEHKKISMREIYDKTNISDGTFSNSSGLNEDSLLKFCDYFNDLDANWLITGKGNMLKDTSVFLTEDKSNNQELLDQNIIELQIKLIDKLEKKITDLE